MVNKTVINLPYGWLSSVGAEASGLSEVLALSIVVPCVESLLHPSTFILLDILTGPDILM